MTSDEIRKGKLNDVLLFFFEERFILRCEDGKSLICGILVLFTNCPSEVVLNRPKNGICHINPKAGVWTGFSQR